MQSTNVAFVLWDHYESKANPGTYPLKLCIYIDGDRKYEKTGIRLKPEQWNHNDQAVQKHQHHKEYNIRLKKILHDKQQVISRAVVLETGISHDLFKKKSITPKELLFNSVKGAPFLWSVILAYNNGLSFKDLNTYWLRDFEKWHYDHGYKNSVIYFNFQYLKTLCRKAKEMHLIPANPYEKIGDYFKAPKFESIEKSFLTLEEVDLFFQKFLSWRELYKDVPGDQVPKKYKTLLYFLLGCRTGFRVSDWYKFDYYTRVQRDGYIRLRAKKNKNWVTQKIGGKVRMILDEIKRTGNQLNVHYNTVLVHLKEITSEINKELKEDEQINKHITSHTARHSYGYRCAKMHVPKHIAQELMGIASDIIDVYYHLTGETIEEYADEMAKD